MTARVQLCPYCERAPSVTHRTELIGEEWEVACVCRPSASVWAASIEDALDRWDDYVWQHSEVIYCPSPTAEVALPEDLRPAVDEVWAGMSEGHRLSEDARERLARDFARLRSDRLSAGGGA